MQWDPPPSALGETEASAAAQLRVGEGAVAEAGASPGLALVAGVFWVERDGLYLGRLAIDPAWRRRGIARALLIAAEAAARDRGLARLHLGTRHALEGNRALLAHTGFVECGRHAHPGFSSGGS